MMNQNNQQTTAPAMEVKVGRKKKSSQQVKKNIGTILAYSALIALAIIWLYPILWIVLHSFREVFIDGNYRGIITSNYFPESYGFETYRRLFLEYQRGTYRILFFDFEGGIFIKWFYNTLIVALASFFISTIMQLSVAYVMSKIKFEKRKLFLNIAIILGLFPGFMSMIAVYFVLKALGLTQTLFGLILVYSAGAGLGFYIAKGFFDIIPNSLVEAAKIDGATNSRIFTSIILPISKPIIIYTALMTFIGPWMDFIFARVILGSDQRQIHTVAIGLYDMIYGEHADTNNFTLFAAGAVIVAIPIVTLFLSLQRYYVEGVTTGSVK
jgi:arabinogalactan oligomer/maltooligosaccharide transport system permease protein